MYDQVINPAVIQSTEILSREFGSALPFKHICIDDFFSEELANDVAAQFPTAASREANRYGAAGEKAVREDLMPLGPVFRSLHRYLGSPAFVDWLSTITGIKGLQYDLTNYGGGTHENFDGRDLRPHVDFNFHPVTKLHRRLNLIVYFNEDWDPAWGGSLSLYSDPRDPLAPVVEYEARYNRCVIFETSERSWHGFDRINLPLAQKHRSRRSLSIYFYTYERPDDEVYAEHTTFYVPRPLPDRFSVGLTLTHSDVHELGELLGQRDRLIELYQLKQGEQVPDAIQSARLRILVTQLASQLAIPTVGFVLGEGNVSGRYLDGWCGPELRFVVRAERPIGQVRIRASIPQGMAAGTIFGVAVDGETIAESEAAPGELEVGVALQLAAGSRHEFRITTSNVVNYQLLGLSPDERDLGFFIERVLFEEVP